MRNKKNFWDADMIQHFFVDFRYGHFEVTELLVKHGASVNACDLWRFTPLHEGAAKGKYEIVKLLLKHGADPTKKNRDGHTAIDLVIFELKIFIESVFISYVL